MLTSTMKLLFLAIALVCVAARPEFDFPETEADELDKAPVKPLPAVFSPCPFDCSSVCVIKYELTWGKPPVSNIFYKCHHQVHACCKEACQHYQNCLQYSQPWVCYAETLDYICKCRSIPKPKIPLKIEEYKSIE